MSPGRRFLATFALALALALPAGSAHAGEYTVVVCHDNAALYGASWGNEVFSASTTGPGGARGWCQPYWGMSTDVGGGVTWFPDGGELETCAPPGTRFAWVDMEIQRDWQGSGYYSVVDGGRCGGYGLVSGGHLPSSFHTIQDWHGVASGLDSLGLRLVTVCAAHPCVGNWALTRYRNIRLIVRDDAGGPSLHEHSGLWHPHEWVRGTRSTGFTAEDNVGVKRMRIEMTGGSGGAGWPHDDPKPCDYARLVPCLAGRVGTGHDLDTRRVADGRQTLRYGAQDSGGEWSYDEKPVHVDNTPPTADPARADGDGGVEWEVADAHSGVDGGSLIAEYSLDGASWVRMVGSWDPGRGTYSATLPTEVPEGPVRVRIRGADRAQPGGNAFSSGASTVAIARARPPAPDVGSPSRWLNAGDPVSYEAALSTPAPHPASGVAGYSVTRDGSDPDATIDLHGSAARYRVEGLAEGTTTIRARAVSGAGTAGDVATAVVRVDRGAPVVTLRGAGSPGTPHPDAVTVAIGARDHIAGMGDDAYVAYRLDGAAAITRVAGDEAQVRVAGEGTHVLEYFAVDAAGNRSATQSRAIDIGTTTRAEAPARFWHRTANPGTTFAAARRFGAPCPEEATLTADRDASLDEREPNAHGGALDVLDLGPGRVALVGFPLPAAPDCAVRSATLTLRAAPTGATGALVEVRRASAAWDEAAVTWNSRPGAVGAAAAGATAWDVTAQVQALYTYGDNGLHLRAPQAQSAFCSREAQAPGCAAPQLVVRFSE